MSAAPAVLRELAEDIAQQLSALDIAGQLGVAMKLVCIIARRLPRELQAETGADIVFALMQDLPAGEQ